MATQNRKRVRGRAPQSRWTRIDKRPPPIGVVIEVRHPRGEPELWRCVEMRGSGIFSLESARRGSRVSTSAFGFELWRFPGGRGMTRQQIANVQRAMRARATRLRNLANQALEARLKRERIAAKRRYARWLREDAMPVYRIRRYSGRAGGSNFYHHADVIAPNRHEALRAAKEGRVNNWRWVDTYDTCEKSYCRYEYLYPLRRGEGKQPARPITRTEALRRERARRRAQRERQN